MGNMVGVHLATPKNERQLTVHRVLKILGFASCIIEGLCYSICP
jgi:hypothetical protein